MELRICRTFCDSSLLRSISLTSLMGWIPSCQLVLWCFLTARWIERRFHPSRDARLQVGPVWFDQQSTQRLSFWAGLIRRIWEWISQLHRTPPSLCQRRELGICEIARWGCSWGILILSNRLRKSTERRHTCQSDWKVEAISLGQAPRCTIRASRGPANPWIERISAGISSPWGRREARRLQLLRRERAELRLYNSFLTRSLHLAHSLQMQSRSFSGFARFLLVENRHFGWKSSLYPCRYLLQSGQWPECLIIISIACTACSCCSACSSILYKPISASFTRWYILSSEIFPIAPLLGVHYIYIRCMVRPWESLARALLSSYRCCLYGLPCWVLIVASSLRCRSEWVCYHLVQHCPCYHWHKGNDRARDVRDKGG